MVNNVEISKATLQHQQTSVLIAAVFCLANFRQTQGRISFSEARGEPKRNVSGLCDPEEKPVLLKK